MKFQARFIAVCFFMGVAWQSLPAQDDMALCLSEAALDLTGDQVVEDCLFDHRIIGHYTYDK